MGANRVSFIADYSTALFDVLTIRACRSDKERGVKRGDADDGIYPTKDRNLRVLRKGRAFGKTLNACHARLGFSLAPGNKRADRFARLVRV
jgi:hypothetical protein